MPIYLDDAPITPEGPLLGHAIDAAQKICQDDKRMLVEVRLGGQVVPSAELEKRLAENVDTLDIHLYTADPTALTLSVLQQVEQRLGEAETMQQDAADLLQRGETQAGFQRVGEAVKPWLETQQAVVQSAALTGVSLDDLQVDGEPVQACINSLLASLKELRDLITSQDTVALADVLQYEWPDTTAKWRRLMASLREQINAED